MRDSRTIICAGALALCLPCAVLAQGTSTNGAPPATSGGNNGGGKTAAVNGGGGAAGEYGTDPASLSKQQAQREKAGEKAGKSAGASD
jgi:Spy/CpxP family protein refolding chaperone